VIDTPLMSLTANKMKSFLKCFIKARSSKALSKAFGFIEEAFTFRAPFMFKICHRHFPLMSQSASESELIAQQAGA
jgi:hypothetical protein